MMVSSSWFTAAVIFGLVLVMTCEGGSNVSDYGVITPNYFVTQKSEGLIPEGYSPLVPPPNPDGPTQVAFSVIIMNVRDIHETTQEFSLEMNLRIHWVDSRLANRTGESEFLVINPGLMDREIWHPDVFIDHAKDIKSPLLLSKPASLRLHSNGRLRYSARITVVMSCHMNFQYYPADVQHCDVDLKTYGYPTSILVFGWHKGVTPSFISGLAIPNFDLDLYSPGVFNTTSSSGVYSGIRFTVSMIRRMSYHMLQTYLPSSLLIFVSWLTLIIPQDIGALPICMTLLLTTVAMFGSVRQNSPNVSYVKALDIWMVACIFSIFLVFVQHAVTIRMRHMKFAIKLKSKRNIAKRKQQMIGSNVHDQPDDPPLDDDPSVLGVAYRLHGKDSLQRGAQLQIGHDIGRRYAKEPPHLDSSAPPQGPPPPLPSSIQQTEADKELATKKLIEGYKLLGNQIRKVFSLSCPVIFFIFNLIYWPWIMKS